MMSDYPEQVDTSPTGYHECPECGHPGEYGLNTATWSFDRCPKCRWPGQ